MYNCASEASRVKKLLIRLVIPYNWRLNGGVRFSSEYF